MKKIFIFLFFGLCFVSSGLAQLKQIGLEEVWAGNFQEEVLESFNSMNNGEQYTLLNSNSSSQISAIEKFNYKSLEKVETVVSSEDNMAIPYFTTYEFSKDETKILLGTEIESIYRRSTKGVYYVLDLVSRQVSQVSEEKIQEPAFSPDGNKIAYAQENNLYVYDLKSSITVTLTTDGIKNSIINGIADWVYEEEFYLVRAFQWNADGTKLAYLRFDETSVPVFSMDIYGSNLYPSQSVFKYPKAGEENAKVSLHIYDLSSTDIVDIALNDPYYIPRIQWRNNPQDLSFQTVNRRQNDLKLWSYNTSSKKLSLLHNEKDKAYVKVKDDLTFLPDDRFIWSSEKDGFNHLYLHSQEGKPLSQITMGPWEVTKYYGFNRKKNMVYYQSTENGSINRDVYSINLKGKNKERLTSRTGTNSGEFSTDFTYFINSYSSAATPPLISLIDTSTGEELKVLVNNGLLKSKLLSYDLPEKEFSTININGEDLNMWMIKPSNFDPSKKYPLFMTQYSGPGSQRVANKWNGNNDYWFQMLASNDYIVVCVDGRGTGFKGRDFKKLTYKELGKYEVEDQIAAAEELSKLPYIDETRTGIWGWSYGGFMSTNCLLKGNDVFEMAIAVAPVTSWRFYDTIYTERFMQTPQENPGGYDDNSPLSYPELLKGKYLLVHGSGDDNVHVQNTMRMVEALIQANKDFEWAIYPDKNHGIYSGNTRLHLYTKMTNFIKSNL
ncbi:S9 family peptidase [Eudoraea chungangensis]|uniref:S9 family peptidase n=1 Tax=Eudoraea chungangensis TaxID=1481905 RepID=UPI0023EBD3D1|nr:S9 family peptidase [Eudoraea chungangensis]